MDLRKKIKSNHGESIVETLVAMVIITLSFVMIYSGIMAASKVNDSAAQLNATGKHSGGQTFEEMEPFSINIKHQDMSEDSKITDDYKCYKNSKGYYYYVHD